jgi:hypothetical protein
VEEFAGLTASLDALLAKAGSAASPNAWPVWVEDGCEGVELLHPPKPMARPELLRKLEARPASLAALIVSKVDAPLLAILRARPPGLLVVTGALSPESTEALESLAGSTALRWLGPFASLVARAPQARESRGYVAFAPSRGELEGLRRALPQPRLALSPVPAWLPEWLEHPPLAACVAVGYAPATTLGPAWSRWIKRRPPGDVVVPLGLPKVALDRPRHADLAVVAGGHALERWTGPVFPSPRVLGIVATAADAGAARDPAPHALDLWAQARRALPLTASALGMEAPRPDLPLEAPTAAFLAQRVMLRVEHAAAVAARALPPLSAPDDEPVKRAREVLAASAETLTEHESKVVLRGFGIGITRQAVASSASAAAGFGDQLGYPVVVKALAPGLRRRAEIGAIVLDLANAAAVRRAFAQVVAAVAQGAPTTTLDGVIVAEHVAPGTELHIGVVRRHDGGCAIFGRLLDGFAAVEPVLCPFAADDPLREEDALLFAHAILGRLPVPALRRATDPDVEGLADLARRLARLVIETGDRVRLVELCPARHTERGWIALDARITQRPHLQGA